MKVKEIERTANVAWSPATQHPVYLAAGTAAQQLDATFSTTAALEIYALNLQDPEIEMKSVGSITSEFRFHKLQWSPLVMGEQSGPSIGTLVGGGDNGKIFVWDGRSILSGEEDALRTTLSKHVGAVTALDFNPYQDNLLASGASESEIYIWDLNSPGNPMTPGQKSQPPDDVTCVAWNKQVQHIMASTYAGRCVVWDLRKNEPIIKVSDSMSRIKCKLVAWHPEVPTQMVLSSEDDHSPVIQLWDLRFATSPLKILESHQRGILSMAWCPRDPDLLVSCGKDNRILCWNPNAPAQMGEVVYELPTSNQWSFDVQWCPRNPAIISSCSFDGHISVYSLMGGTEPQAAAPSKIADSFPNDPFAQTQQQTPAEAKKYEALKKPPKWLRRPVGATFGFGGKLITFEQQKPTNPQQPVPRQVTISRVVTETELMTRSQWLERALETGTYSDFCSMKLGEGTDGFQGSLWSFLKARFEKDPHQSLLGVLGYENFVTEDRVEKFLKTGGEVSEGSASALSTGSAGTLSTTEDSPTRQSEEEAPPTPEDHMTRLSSVDDSEGVDAFEKISKSELDESEPLQLNVDTDDGDSLLTQALLTANFRAAVDVCVHSDRMAEAIILAMAGGSELLQQTQRRFFSKQSNSVSKLISLLVSRDYHHIVATSDLGCWAQTLSILLTYTKGAEFSQLCNELGGRLEREGSEEKVHNAALCYICAGNVPKTMECLNRVDTKQGSAESLQDLVEVLVMLRKALELTSGQADQSSSVLVADTLSKYAELLAAQGNLATAIGYLGNSNEVSLAILRERLCHAIPGYQGSLPTRPFNVINVQPEGVKVTSQQAPASSQAPGSRQRTNSGYYQAQPGTTTTPTFSTYSQPGSYSQAGSGVSQPGPGYTQGKGPLSHKYPQLPGTSAPYDPYSRNQYQQPAAAFPTYTSSANYPGDGQVPQPTGPLTGSYTGQPTGQPTSMYDPRAAATSQPNQPGQIYDPRAMAISQPSQPSQIYDPSRMATSQASHSPEEKEDCSSLRSLIAMLKRRDSATGGPQSDPTPPTQPYHGAAHAGWNDPPLLKPSKKVASTPQPPSVSPITAPIYGTQQPEQNPPGAPTYAGQQGYYRHQGEPQPQEQAQAPPQPEPPKPVEKGPLPAEHLVLQQVLETLANQCLTQSNNPHIKRKLEDVLRKLETLYDKLREQMLSESVTLGLHQIVQYIQAYDYVSALQCHARMVSQGNFSEISSFMPGVKMLMQTATQMNVFIQQQ